MPTVSPCLIRSVGPAGDPEVSLGVPLLDEYLEFLSGRCRPNTVLAVAYDLKIFFTVVGKSPKRVRPADVLGFMTAQRAGQGSAAQTVQPVEGERVGVSTWTLRRRLSSVSGLYAFLQRTATGNGEPMTIALRRHHSSADQASRHAVFYGNPRAIGKLDGPRSSQRVSRSEVAGKHRILEESSTAGPSWEAFESQLGGVPDQTATE